MDVRVRVPTPLREVVGGAAQVVVAVDAVGGTVDVGAVLDALAATHPALERRVRDEVGRVRPHVNVFVGEDHIRDLQALATPVPPGIEVSVIAAVSGG